MSRCRANASLPYFPLTLVLICSRPVFFQRVELITLSGRRSILLKILDSILQTFFFTKFGYNGFQKSGRSDILEFIRKYGYQIPRRYKNAAIFLTCELKKSPSSTRPSSLLVVELTNFSPFDRISPTRRNFLNMSQINTTHSTQRLVEVWMVYYDIEVVENNNVCDHKIITHRR